MHAISQLVRCVFVFSLIVECIVVPTLCVAAPLSAGEPPLVCQISGMRVLLSEPGFTANACSLCCVTGPQRELLEQIDSD